MSDAAKLIPLENERTTDNLFGNCEADERRKDPLLDFIPPSSPILDQLLSQGFYVLPSVFTPVECDDAINLLWDFVEDTSGGYVKRDDASTWYPPHDDHNDSYNEDEDPWPRTGYKSISDMFQSNGAGWVLGDVREKLAKRVFEPLFQTRELHSSKEGFTFHRPTAPDNGYKPPQRWLKSLQDRFMAAGQCHELSVENHDDQSNTCNGLDTVRSQVVLENQEEGEDGGFLCYPGSHDNVRAAITTNTYLATRPWIPLTDDEIHGLTTNFGCSPKRLHLSKGDVLLWRSDLAHAQIHPSDHTPRFLAVAYCSMQPSSLTPPEMWLQKMEAYKQRQTGDHRPHVESWHTHRAANPFHRPYYRTSPPWVTFRQAELYGLAQYTTNDHDRELAETKAIIRGVRFLPSDLPTKQPIRKCDAKLVMLSMKTSPLTGQDKYLGGMPSPCGKYIYGVPGTAKRVLRVTVESGVMDLIGPEFEGKFKWLRGLDIPANVLDSSEYPNGCCIGLPCNAPSILKINPANDDVYSFGAKLLADAGCDDWLYHGGNLAPNGWIYVIPANASRVMKVNPKTDEVCYIGPSFSGLHKWYGGITGSDGCIYGIPHTEVGVLRIDPRTDEVSVLLLEDGSPLPTGRWKWHGGIAVGSKIYGYPNNADEVLILDCDMQRLYTVGDNTILQSGRHRIPQDGGYKYLGGAVTLDERYVFLFPCDAERVLRIDTRTDELRLVGPLLLEGENKYQNGFVARDGCLYGIPQRAAGVLRIIPEAVTGDEDHVDVMYCGDDMVGMKDKFEGGVLGYDGCIYCMPLRSRNCVKIVPGESL